MSATSSQEQKADLPAVPWPELVKFVRQLSHDIRNNLNAVELQSAYLAELAEGAELKEEIRRLREMVSAVGAGLQRLTAGLSQTRPTPISYKATEFVEDLKAKVAKEMPDHAAKISWEADLKEDTLPVDPQLAHQAFFELFTNAFQHEPNAKAIKAKASIEKDRFVFQLEEPKAAFESSTEDWGRRPLRNVSQGHYGLGLNRARSIIESHGGEFRAKYDPKTATLTTTITLPLEKA